MLDGRSEATMTSRDRKAYHAAYYRNNRQARSDYQRAYDAKHKAEKAKRELTYKRLQRYGENREDSLMKDTQLAVRKTSGDRTWTILF
jgi:hypothetical protein